MDRPAFLELAILQAIMDDDIPEAVALTSELLPGERKRLQLQIREMQVLLQYARHREE